MQKAQEYLRYTNLSVSKIALEVGYSNFSYFSKSFRDYAGCTPNEYRSKMQWNIIASGKWQKNEYDRIMTMKSLLIQRAKAGMTDFFLFE